MTSRFKMTPEAVAKKMDFPLEDWPGQCYAVACQMVKHRLVLGSPRYGYYYGPVVDSDRFSSAREWQRHGWVERKDGVIVDPTRWVFECVEPYICVGPNPDEYDFGGNRWRAKNMKAPPKAQPADERKLLTFEDVYECDLAWLCGVLNIPYANPVSLTMSQLFYVANYPMHMLGQHAEGIYDTLAAHKLRAMIPIDNWNASNVSKSPSEDIYQP